MIVLIIIDGKKRHYLAVKSLFALLKGITSKHKGDFYCLSCLHSYRPKNRLKKHENVCKDHDYCYVDISNENILKYNHEENSMKLLFIIYVDMESLLEKISTCYNNPKESSTTKINKHTPSGYSLFTHCSFDNAKNRLDYYRGQDCMKKFCKDLNEHATKIINYKEKEMIPLTYLENESFKIQKVCYICKKEFSTDNEDKKYHKIRDHCHFTGKYRGTVHNICNLRYKTPNINIINKELF